MATRHLVRCVLQDPSADRPIFLLAPLVLIASAIHLAPFALLDRSVLQLLQPPSHAQLVLIPLPDRFHAPCVLPDTNVLSPIYYPKHALLVPTHSATHLVAHPVLPVRNVPAPLCYPMFATMDTPRLLQAALATLALLDLNAVPKMRTSLLCPVPRASFLLHLQRTVPFVPLDIRAKLLVMLGKCVHLVPFHSQAMAFALCALPDSSVLILR